MDFNKPLKIYTDARNFYLVSVIILEKKPPLSTVENLTDPKNYITTEK